MEFEELQKIWDSQNNQPLYALDEKALHHRILSKKKQAHQLTNISELLLIIVNSGAGSLILGLNGFNRGSNIFMYVLAAWMFCSAFYLLKSRLQRIKWNRNRFEQSMRGDLDHAISTAAYQVHLSQIMRWNILPIGLLILVAVWEGGKSIWVIGGTLFLFAVAYYASGFEHRIYKAKKRELQLLQKNLENEA
jgi:hypothetical protein